MSKQIAFLILLVLTINGNARGKSVDERIAQYGGAVRERLAPFFAVAGVSYPPSKVTLIGLKAERELQLYAAGTNGAYRFIRSYPILAASGGLGPKLREGDMQVPEGLYQIESLNPNSRFHLSLRINYPNTVDRARAEKEGRKNLGGDIMIHGNSVSIGCLAMGDPAAEELFVLVARTGLRNTQVILSPVDFRVRPAPVRQTGAPPWVDVLYGSIKNELSQYKMKQDAEPSAASLSPAPRTRPSVGAR
ncbi:MAG: L,D-transpeptidase family protein [Kiritimatiellae bacterium]|nr:L,D-transpeptidase family protein [Kiritimatiellia bacterium]